MIAWILVAVLLGTTCGVLMWQLTRMWAENSELKTERDHYQSCHRLANDACGGFLENIVQLGEDNLVLSNRIAELEENGKQLKVSRATTIRLRKELAKLQKQLKPPTKTKKGAKPV